KRQKCHEPSKSETFGNFGGAPTSPPQPPRNPRCAEASNGNNKEKRTNNKSRRRFIFSIRYSLFVLCSSLLLLLPLRERAVILLDERLEFRRHFFGSADER